MSLCRLSSGVRIAGRAAFTADSCLGLRVLAISCDLASSAPWTGITGRARVRRESGGVLLTVEEIKEKKEKEKKKKEEKRETVADIGTDTVCC